MCTLSACFESGLLPVMHVNLYIYLVNIYFIGTKHSVLLIDCLVKSKGN